VNPVNPLKQTVVVKTLDSPMLSSFPSPSFSPTFPPPNQPIIPRRQITSSFSHFPAIDNKFSVHLKAAKEECG
jgi:hypothetical protein